MSRNADRSRRDRRLRVTELLAQIEDPFGRLQRDIAELFEPSVTFCDRCQRKFFSDEFPQQFTLLDRIIRKRSRRSRAAARSKLIEIVWRNTGRVCAWPGNDWGWHRCDACSS